MAYDERLAERIRELIGARPGVVERKMFGGVGWTIGGNMAVGVMREDEVVVRIEPEETEAACREPHVHEFGREGRKPMKGFVLVEPAGVESDADLARWVDVGAARAASMPPKKPKAG
jgi:TfoX/Sxy family transcriptional regulator of competence genes